MKITLVIMLALLSMSAWAGKEYDEAMKMVKAQKYTVAKVLLEAEAKKNPESKVLYALGYVAEKQKDEDLAVKYFKTVLKMNLEKSEDPKVAGWALTRLIALRPAYSPVFEAAESLRRKANTAQGGDKEYLEKAVKMLEDYVLNVDVPVANNAVPASEIGKDTVLLAKNGMFAVKEQYKWSPVGMNALTDDGVKYDEVIAACAPSRLEIKVPFGMRIFTAKGLARPHPDADASIYDYVVIADGKEVGRFAIGKKNARHVDINVRLPIGTKVLELVVDPKGSNKADGAVWAWPRLHSMAADLNKSKGW